MSQEAGGDARPVAPPGAPAFAPAPILAEAGSALVQVRRGLAAALGFGPRRRSDKGPTDTGTRLAQQRTDLAIERSYLAAERTLMAWIRTALSMISFGFTIGKLGQTVAEIQVKGVFRGPRMVGVETIAYYLVILGTLALCGAILQFARSVGEYTAMGLERRFSISLVVGLILVVLGGFALTALMMQL